MQCDEHIVACYSPMAQIVLSFFTGVLLSPWSYGFIFLLIFIVIWEIWWIWYLRLEYITRIERPLVIIAAFLGWLVGRTAAKLPVLESGKDKMKEWWDCYIK